MRLHWTKPASLHYHTQPVILTTHSNPPRKFIPFLINLVLYDSKCRQFKMQFLICSSLFFFVLIFIFPCLFEVFFLLLPLHPRATRPGGAGELQGQHANMWTQINSRENSHHRAVKAPLVCCRCLLLQSTAGFSETLDQSSIVALASKPALIWKSWVIGMLQSPKGTTGASPVASNSLFQFRQPPATLEHRTKVPACLVEQH